MMKQFFISAGGETGAIEANDLLSFVSAVKSFVRRATKLGAFDRMSDDVTISSVDNVNHIGCYADGYIGNRISYGAGSAEQGVVSFSHQGLLEYISVTAWEWE
jgi:hypothetical protein